MHVDVADSLEAIAADEWNALTDGSPFVSHAFLSALHDTGCASAQTGWTPVYLTLVDGDALVGAMPLYLKTHSRGEYVFDYGWAEAYHQHGLRYYPKLLSAIPFTPVAGARLLARTEEHRARLAQSAIDFARRSGVSSLHILFPHDADRELLQRSGFMLREGMQFHWQNQGFDTFEAFLNSMNHDKRKKIRQDRRRVFEAGIEFRHKRGSEIDADGLAFFHRCYLGTYRNHGSPPYLTLEFFRTLHRTMPEAMMLTLALRDGQPIASALNIIGQNVLYGRYWGASEFVSGLHFETCYSQAIEYCIDHGIRRFEGGAQGLHKLSRGLLPIPTWSAHWVADPRFADAIGHFLQHEADEMEHYLNELEAHAPFKTA